MIDDQVLSFFIVLKFLVLNRFCYILIYVIFFKFENNLGNQVFYLYFIKEKIRFREVGGKFS